jgi:hypothetical protein
MACPYFMPGEITTVAGLPHPERLPLGAAYNGHCTAAGVACTPEMLHDCNVGYADCEHLPADRTAEAVRFSMRRDAQGLLAIQYLCEAGHAPVSYGVLVFDPASAQWRERHADSRIHRMAECCVESFRKQQ